MDLKVIEKLTSEKFWRAKSKLNRTKIQRVFDNCSKKIDKSSFSTSFLNGKFVSVNFYVRDEVLDSYVELKFRFSPLNPRESLNFSTEVDSLPEIRILYKDTTYRSYETYNKALKRDINNKIKELNLMLAQLEKML